MSATKRLLVDPDKCTGCNRCVYACAAEHEGAFAPSLARLAVNIYPLQGYSVPSICFHCIRPDCAEACPEGAILKGADGIVTVDADLCTGCGQCVPACPWGMVAKHPATGKAFKCDLCGGDPACVRECGFEALTLAEPDKERTVARAKQMKNRPEPAVPEWRRNAFGKAVMTDAGRA